MPARTTIAGFYYRELSEYDLALADYTSAITIDPLYANAHWSLGNVHYELGNYEDAITAYREYERINGSLQSIMVTRIRYMEFTLENDE